jgi:hypothetical protein
MKMNAGRVYIRVDSQPYTPVAYEALLPSVFRVQRQAKANQEELTVEAAPDQKINKRLSRIAT